MKKETVELRRIFDAPIELVYAAWTRPEHVVKWLKCAPDVETRVENWVPRVGAEYRLQMIRPGVFESHSSGTFLEVDPPHKLVYSCHANEELGVGEVTVRVELAEVPGGTELKLTYTGAPNDEIRGIVEAGWTTSLASLRDIFAANKIS